MDLTRPVTLFYLVTCAGLCVGIGSHETVKVVAGHDAILPCHLEPFSGKVLMVEWTCDGKKVHLYRSGADDLDNQDKDFRNRTSLFHDEMVRGNFSLKLTNVTERDAGNYTCNVHFKNGSENEERRCNVTLIVDTKPKSTPSQKRRDDTEPKSTPSQKRSDENPVPIGYYILGAVVGGVLVIVAGFKCNQRRNNKSEEKTEKKGTTEIRYWRGRKRRSSDDNNPFDNVQSTRDTSN